MEATATPWKVGVSAGKSLLPSNSLPGLRQQVTQAADLRDLSREVFLFHPGLIYTAINLAGRDPIADFCEETNRDLPLIRLTFDTPVARGFRPANDAWNYLLYGLPLDSGQELTEWLGTLSLLDRGRRVFTRIRYWDGQLVDPLWLRRQTTWTSQLQRAPVRFFCVDTNLGCVGWRQPLGFGLPELVGGPAYPDTVAMAQALFEGQADPYGTMEQALAAGGESLAEQEIKARVAEYRASIGGTHVATPSDRRIQIA